jgi:hypothetical protein
MKAKHVGLAGLLPILIVASTAPAATITVPADMDSALYESPTGTIGGGQSFSVFVGRLGPNGGELRRRGAVAFDLSAIPSNSVIDSVTLQMTLSRGSGGATPIELHRFTKAWGEGASNGGPQGAPATTGDVTWVHNFFNSSTWTTPGGDFVEAVSSVQNADFSGTVTWPSTAQLRADVQGWVANPATNFGWILIGNEAGTATAKQFNSRENPGGPSLTVNFTVPEPTSLAALAGALLLIAGRRRR